jgi:hypothetical protein
MSQQKKEYFRHRFCTEEDIMNSISNDFVAELDDNAYLLESSQNNHDKFEESIIKKLKNFTNDPCLNIINVNELDLMKENEYLLNSFADKAVSSLESENLSLFGDSQDLLNDIKLEIQARSNVEKVPGKEIKNSAEAEAQHSSTPAKSISIANISDESKARRYSKKDDIGK